MVGAEGRKGSSLRIRTIGSDYCNVGEVVSPREGTRVGDSMLRRIRSVFVRDSVISLPPQVYLLCGSTRHGYGR